MESGSSKGCERAIVGFPALESRVRRGPERVSGRVADHVPPDREVVDALVHPAHAGPPPRSPRCSRTGPAATTGRTSPTAGISSSRGRSPAARSAGACMWRCSWRPSSQRPSPERWWRGRSPSTTAFALHRIVSAAPHLVSAWAAGLSFSLPLLAILLCHELVTIRRASLRHRRFPSVLHPGAVVSDVHRDDGAFIRLRSVLNDRRQLFDIGVWGPIAGFVVALRALARSGRESRRLRATARLPGCCSRWEPRPGSWATRRSRSSRAICSTTARGGNRWTARVCGLGRDVRDDAQPAAMVSWTAGTSCTRDCRSGTSV